MKIRLATSEDADGMSAILTQILAMWESDRPSGAEHVRGLYIEHPDSICCSVAASKSGVILGFQSLQLATDANPYGVTEGWGIIGTYVKLDTGRRGIGSALFAATLQAAQQAGLTRIDATIGAENKLGLSYYEAMGFRTYREKPKAICKYYAVAAL